MSSSDVAVETTGTTLLPLEAISACTVARESSEPEPFVPEYAETRNASLPAAAAIDTEHFCDASQCAGSPRLRYVAVPAPPRTIAIDAVLGET